MKIDGPPDDIPKLHGTQSTGGVRAQTADKLNHKPIFTVLECAKKKIAKILLFSLVSLIYSWY